MADSWPHINLIDFHFRDLEITIKAQPRSKVKVYFYSFGQCEHICIYRHPGPTSNRCDDMHHFHFRDLENTLKGQPSTEVKGHCGFGTSGVKFPSVFHSNHVSISHSFEAGVAACSAGHRVGPLSTPLLENG